MKNYAGLFELIEAENGAREYFEALPAFVREQIADRADSVNSFASLRDYAENLTRGDG